MPETQTKSPLSPDAIRERNQNISKHAEMYGTDRTHHAITINKPAPELYAYWRNFENLATFMKDIESITVLGPKRSHWVVKLKSGAKAEWDAEITEDVPGQKISWSSVAGSEVKTTGTVWFQPATGNRGGVVRLSMNYEVPGGKLTEIIAMFTGEDPDTLMMVNLRRFKSMMETGVIPTIEGQPSGREDDSQELKH